MEITTFIIARRDKALLVGSYSLYRQQLSRRLLVVRKKLNVSSTGRKYTPKAPITAENIAGNHESVAVLVQLFNIQLNVVKVCALVASLSGAGLGVCYAHEIHPRCRYQY